MCQSRSFGGRPSDRLTQFTPNLIGVPRTSQFDGLWRYLGFLQLRCHRCEQLPSWFDRDLRQWQRAAHERQLWLLKLLEPRKVLLRKLLTHSQQSRYETWLEQAVVEAVGSIIGTCV